MLTYSMVSSCCYQTRGHYPNKSSLVLILSPTNSLFASKNRGMPNQQKHFLHAAVFLEPQQVRNSPDTSLYMATPETCPNSDENTLGSPKKDMQFPGTWGTHSKSTVVRDFVAGSVPAWLCAPHRRGDPRVDAGAPRDH